MSIETILHDEITDEMRDLSKIEVGTEQYKVAVDGVTKLIDRQIELKKVNNEIAAKEIDRDIDSTFKESQMVNEKKNNLTRNIIDVAGIVIPVAVTVWGAQKSWKFEETGTVTSLMGRGFIQKLLPKK